MFVWEGGGTGVWGGGGLYVSFIKINMCHTGVPYRNIAWCNIHVNGSCVIGIFKHWASIVYFNDFFFGGGAGPNHSQFVQSPPIWRVDESQVDNGLRQTEMGGWLILSFNRFLIQIIFRILKQTYSQYGNTGLFN